MKIAIIGGSGFIGTRLTARLLDRGFTVRIIDKEKSLTYGELWFYGDVREPDSLLQALKGVDVIYNLAAEHRDDVSPVSLYFDVNVQGAENVCKAATTLGIKKIIFSSSVAVYGNAPKDTDETGETLPINHYGSSKLQAEAVYRDWCKKSFNCVLTIIRPTVTFGEKNRGNVYNLLKQMNSGRFFIIGKGTNIKSMAYVENVAAFLEYSLIFETGARVFNYVDKPDFNMRSLVAQFNMKLGKGNSSGLRIPYFIGLLGGYCFDFISLVTGKKLAISSIRVKKFAQDTMFRSGKIDDLYFNPPVSLLEGLDRTIEYEFQRKS
jgi:nucleoside-diphosphate-sugar epimerase